MLAELQDERRKREEAEGLLEAKGAIVTELMADIARLREEESIRVAEQQMLVERLMESKATLEADVRGLHRDKEELERASASTPKSAMPPRTVAAGPSNCETEARAPIPRLCLAIGRGGRLAHLLTRPGAMKLLVQGGWRVLFVDTSAQQPQLRRAVKAYQKEGGKAESCCVAWTAIGDGDGGGSDGGGDSDDEEGARKREDAIAKAVKGLMGVGVGGEEGGGAGCEEDEVEGGGLPALLITYALCEGADSEANDAFYGSWMHMCTEAYESGSALLANRKGGGAIVNLIEFLLEVTPAGAGADAGADAPAAAATRLFEQQHDVCVRAFTQTMANAHRVEGTTLNTVVVITTCRDVDDDDDDDDGEGEQQGGAVGIGTNPLGIDSDALLASCMDLATMDISACAETDHAAKTKSTAADASTGACGSNNPSEPCVRADELVGSALVFAASSTKRCSGNTLFINAVQMDEEEQED